jgi:hypothetical protein
MRILRSRLTRMAQIDSLLYLETLPIATSAHVIVSEILRI